MKYRWNARVIIQLATVVMVLFVSADTGFAIPSFSKKYKLACSECHTAWPMLNAFGRRFKENGYRVTRYQTSDDKENVKTDGMDLYRQTPVTVRIKGYMADKKKDKVTKIRPFHEFELMLAGNAQDLFSVWAEVEGEDEDNWEVKAETGVIGFHPYAELNVLAGYAPVFWADPYQPLADGGRRFTRAHKVIADLGFSTGQRLRKSTPLISAYGRLANRFFYATGVSTGTGDPEGEDRKDFHLRGAVDLNDHIMVGGFLLDGSKYFGTSKQPYDFARRGFDFQIDYNNVVVFGAYMRTSDDIDSFGLSEANDVFYTQGMYIFRKGTRPIVAPIVRIEHYSTSDGTFDYTDGNFGLTFYPVENINCSLEFWKNLSTPSGVEEKYRLTFLVNVLF